MNELTSTHSENVSSWLDILYWLGIEVQNPKQQNPSSNEREAN